MRSVLLLAGAAAMAIAGPALGQGKGNGNGGGNGGGGERGGPAKPGKPQGGPERGNQGGPKADRGGPERMAQRGPDKAKGSDRGPQMRSPAKEDRGGPGKAMAERAGPGPQQRGNGPDKMRGPEPRQADAGPAFRGAPDRRDVQRITSRTWQDGRYRYDDRAWVVPVRGDCPPGLAKKNNGCLPPGQARALNPVSGWSGWYPVRYDNDGYDYRYNNGYLYRLGGGGLVSGIVPLLGGALFGGQVWPTQYSDYAVPTYYDRYYGFDDGYDYRYAQNAVFEVDPQTQMIQGIAALLTGDQWAVGQPMPAGYDFYNVPPTWRDRYVDGPDNWYRYSDGYVYDIDPTTQLVRSIIELIA